jgi:sugar phosphate isomerase/epimerase
MFLERGSHVSRNQHPFHHKVDFEDGLQFAQDLGLKGMEVAAGEQAAKEYCDLDKLLADEDERHRWLDAFARHGLAVVSLSCHGAPLMPEENIAAEYRRQFRQACEVMATLRFIGYDDILSLEMECEWMDVKEAIEKSVDFIKPIMLERPADPKWWEHADWRMRQHSSREG